MKKFTLSLAVTSLFLVMAFICKAQQALNIKSDTISWQYGNGENIAKSESLSITGRFISYGDKSFRWIQNGTDKQYVFDVKSVNGSWPDISKTGEVEYTAVCEGISGTIRIYRSGGSVDIHLDFNQKDKLTPNIVLKVNSFSKI